jgi:hypothetical protein
MRLVTLLLAGLALVLVSVGSSYLLVVDTSSGTSCTSSPAECTSYSETLVEDQGAGVLVLLLAPIVIAGFVTWGLVTQPARTFELPLAALFLLFCIISIFSIGAFYFLGAFVLLLATISDCRSRDAS